MKIWGLPGKQVTRLFLASNRFRISNGGATSCSTEASVTVGAAVVPRTAPCSTSTTAQSNP